MAIMASEKPVLPEVVSTMVLPSFNIPFLSAFSTICNAILSF